MHLSRSAAYARSSVYQESAFAVCGSGGSVTSAGAALIAVFRRHASRPRLISTRVAHCISGAPEGAPTSDHVSTVAMVREGSLQTYIRDAPAWEKAHWARKLDEDVA